MHVAHHMKAIAESIIRVFSRIDFIYFVCPNWSRESRDVRRLD